MPREATQAQTVTVQGIEVPKLGYGTWLVEGQDAYDGVLDALSLGYRHIDTARAYGNERWVGRALSDAGVPREEIWLTTKVWYEHADPHVLRSEFEQQLSDLHVEHVDLLLLHWPAAETPLARTLGEMDALRQRGLVGHIGVSNFPSELLREAISLAPIFCDQVEYHPYLPQGPVMHECLEHDLLLTAYSPFAHGYVHEDATLKEIGARHGKSAGQVALRWLLDQPNVATIPKASSHERRAENMDIFDFELDDDERAAVAALSQRHLRTADPDWAPDWD
ncbi:MAG TPA: aldo/keto reductase [Conexibacter sp.]|jgi:diketogulonate reductase-like aldo/keto reductase|nr:aldo/keto reductase [Conexibacter sp.]